MNRYLIILIAVLVVFSVATVGIGLWLRSNNPTSAGQGTLATLPSVGGSQPVTTNPTGTPSQPVSTTQSVGAQSVSQSKPAVEAATQTAMAEYSSDNIQFYASVISGGYALQDWSGDTMGGEALLQYDPAANSWTVLTDGGGAWTIGDLTSFSGMSTSTATVLLAGMPQ